MTERVDLEELRELMTDARNYDVDTMYGAKVHKEFGDAIEALIAELTELRAQAGGVAPIYPDSIGGQRVMQPAPEVKIVVAPSGFADRIYHGHQGCYERIVRYVLAPLLNPPEATDG